MSTQSDLFDDKISENRTSLPPNWAVHQGQGGSTSYYLNTITGEMQSTYPYEDNNDFYDNYSDEDSTTSTIDSRQSPSTELLESQYSSSPFSEQGKVKQYAHIGSFHTDRISYMFIHLISGFSVLHLKGCHFFITCQLTRLHGMQILK